MSEILYFYVVDIDILCGLNVNNFIRSFVDFESSIVFREYFRAFVVKFLEIIFVFGDVLFMFKGYWYYVCFLILFVSVNFWF